MSALHEHLARDGFRLRGTAMSRIDAFSDVVFGFALTLLIVSLEVPHTYDGLVRVLLGFGPFCICFAFFMLVWYAHYRFFRLYGLHDIATIVLNAGLLFCLLFYVYPLKFLFTLAIQTPAEPAFNGLYQTRHLMVIYGLGLSSIYLFLALLYANAWRLRETLQLNAYERSLTVGYMTGLLGTVLAGLGCALAACLLPPQHAGQAGWFFFSIGVYKTIHGFIAGRHARAARQRCSSQELTAPVHTCAE